MGTGEQITQATVVIIYPSPNFCESLSKISPSFKINFDFLSISGSVCGIWFLTYFFFRRRQPGHRFDTRMSSYQYRDSDDRLICIVGIPTPGKTVFVVKRGPAFLQSLKRKCCHLEEIYPTGWPGTKFVKLTTSNVASDKNLLKMTTFQFRWWDMYLLNFFISGMWPFALVLSGVAVGAYRHHSGNIMYRHDDGQCPRLHRRGHRAQATHALQPADRVLGSVWPHGGAGRDALRGQLRADGPLDAGPYDLWHVDLRGCVSVYSVHPQPVHDQRGPLLRDHPALPVRHEADPTPHGPHDHVCVAVRCPH